MKPHRIDPLPRRQLLAAAATLGVAPWLLSACATPGGPVPLPPHRRPGASDRSRSFPSASGASGTPVPARGQ